MKNRESKKSNVETKRKRITIKEDEIIQETINDNENKKATNTKKAKFGLRNFLKNRKKWDKKKKRRVILGVVIAFILLIGIIFGTYIYKSDGNIANAALNMAADVLGDEDPIFILVLGISEDLANDLTDTIMLAGYNPDSQKAFMISIPRDTFVGNNEATAGGYDKINALYQSGPEKTVEAVEKLTGIKIDNYVVVRNTVLPAMVDAIGEVEFDVPIDMDYDDPTQDLHIHLKAGVQMINGEEAEQLLRFRHNNDGSSYPIEYGDNDYGRMRTQREFMMVVAKKLIKLENVSKLKDIASAIFDNLITDMSITKMLGYVPHAARFDANNIRSEQLPGASAKLNELWFYRNDSYETYDLINELLTDLELTDKEKEKYYTPTKKVKNKPVTVTPENEVDPNSTEHSHVYTELVTKVPSCKREGERRLTCACGDTYTEVIKETAHSYGKPVEKIEGNKKTITKTCTECGTVDTKTETIKIDTNTDSNDNNAVDKEEHVHKYVENTTKNATCVEVGSKTITCSVSGCTYSEVKEIQKLTTHTPLENITKVATCVEVGSKTITCSVSGCTYSEVKEIQKLTTHTPLENTTKNATCVEVGSKTITCSVSGCTYSEVQEIPATGHTKDETTGLCSVCSQPVV